ncbi:MAG: RNA polymerase sigma factor [Daejeonella sp.]|uniref:RNA polymerase sigma factor n=1 Tax=Daejeonella sp. JGW-45 TaxID=3034148 RepID=UPI0023EDE17F|nr:RNA polymerase sigma factor [Daejeonella sp. JGW-45]
MDTLEFNSVVTSQRNSLALFALHFTHDPDDANDLVQDTMLKAITYYTKFKDGTNIKGWLYTIMKNTFINNYRKLVRTNTFIVRADDISDANLSYAPAKNLAEPKFIMEDLQAALSKLPEAYYVPFTMYFEGYHYYEIADHLKIPLGTVKTRIHVARQLMKKYLKTYDTGREAFYAD